MLAKSVREIPRGPGLVYEPKWDGFRCVVFRDGDEVELGSRNDRPLTRYFPELVELIRQELPTRCVVDGEIVIVTGSGLDFDALQNRLHPAASRVRLLAERTPASFVAFDLLALDDRDLTEEPFARRRELLEGLLDRDLARIHLTPLTDDPDRAQDWFTRFEGAGFDGVMAKRADLPYEQDRRVMWKVKHERTADCVVAGFRWHKDGQGVGSLLLGLYDENGTLHHVGVASSFTAARRRELVDELAPLRENALEHHPWRDWARAQTEASAAGGRMPGGVSRWTGQKDLSWEPLRPELVAEVRYEHVQAGRFRHGSRLARFRPDRRPESCTYAQLEEVPPAELAAFFTAARRPPSIDRAPAREEPAARRPPSIDRAPAREERRREECGHGHGREECGDDGREVRGG
ncbi:ATP-dependent DNA ligase [Amycolatopsis arida]|uniref:DNA ligase (ATP) n=2 Tax=Amycolatopsis arida TaxID=587909 RepID=A0A1I5LUZ5_9PSEU|nr:ATP-dependent DNA ligase [Amycolatopsis arida]SFP01065.1 ATP-dependent DNA ligase [Amycolatopsis arida]